MDTKLFNYPRNYASEPYSGVPFEMELFSRVLSGLSANPAMCGTGAKEIVALAEEVTAHAIVRLGEISEFTPSGE